jgi:hypothetical protein
MIDATVAGGLANSYLTVAAADALAEREASDDPEVSAWLSAHFDDKQRWLIRATSEIDAELLTGWRAYTVGQALLFPREIDIIGTGPYIPTRIARATFYQAIYLAANSKTLGRARARRARDLQMSTEPNMSYMERGGQGQGRTGIAHQPPLLSDRALHYLGAYRRADSRRGIRSLRAVSGFAR